MWCLDLFQVITDQSQKARCRPIDFQGQVIRLTRAYGRIVYTSRTGHQFSKRAVYLRESCSPGTATHATLRQADWTKV